MSEIQEMPIEVGVCAFVDGTYEVYPHLADVPPSTKYVRGDIADELLEALEEVKATIGDKTSLNDLFIGTILITIDNAIAKAKGQS